MRTRADRDGDRWVVNGAKTWSTFAFAADYALCLARAQRRRRRIALHQRPRRTADETQTRLPRHRAEVRPPGRGRSPRHGRRNPRAGHRTDPTRRPGLGRHRGRPPAHGPAGPEPREPGPPRAWEHGNRTPPPVPTGRPPRPIGFPGRHGRPVPQAPATGSIR
ncbi:hypothetical protein [Yinghuangia sp. ASG 101]|uniref:hypothetical protein n=1 Tax=Yinghuangia sp. ASG 101 TaxID=2896848 RepID=UPI002F9074B1